MVVHECNAYCRGDLHTSLSHTPVDWDMEEVNRHVVRLLAEHGMELVSLYPAPEGAGVPADTVWVETKSTLVMSDTDGVFHHTPETHNTWLIHWRVSTETLMRYRDEMRRRVEEMADALDRSRREDGPLPGEGKPGT